MRVLPVLDLMGGLAVRGVGGRRETYRPLVSRWCDSSEPLAVARGVRSRFALDEFYIADLDAILGGPPQRNICESLAGDGFRLWIDSGVRNSADAQAALEWGAQTVVLGLETISGPGLLREIVENRGSERLVFSLDLKDGVPMGDLTAWRGRDPFDIAAEAVGEGALRILVLDLAGVGMSGGLRALELCRRLRASFPALELSTGGGVRDRRDLDALRAEGLDAALVATALHSGALTEEDVSAS